MCHSQCDKKVPSLIRADQSPDGFYKIIKRTQKELTTRIGASREATSQVLRALASAYLDLGLLHKARGKRDRAKEYISTSIKLFEQCEADVFLKKAQEALETLG